MGKVSALIKSNFVPKCLELVLAAVSIGLVIDGDPMLVRIPTLATVYGTQVGFIMIGMIVVHSYLFDHPMHKMILALIAIAGLAMWMATGILIIHYYRQAVSVEEPKNVTTDSPLGILPFQDILKTFGSLLGGTSSSSRQTAVNVQPRTGGFCVQAKPDSRLLISGIVALFNAFVYLIDVVITFKT